MAWFFSKRKPKGQKPASEVLDTGSHRSPGLEMLAADLLSHARHSILDLGASSTHNVELFSRMTEDVMVVALFQSCIGSEGRSGHRARPFRFDETVLEILPDVDEQFAAVLLWDLPHYFDAELFDRFTERLEACLEPGAMIYLLASNNAPVPFTPISFQVEPGRLRYGKLESCNLHYQVPDGERSTDLRLLTRDVERRMARFRPQRLFQLRNGYQEFVFRKAGERRIRATPSEDSEPSPEPAPPRPHLLGPPPTALPGRAFAAVGSHRPEPAVERVAPEPAPVDESAVESAVKPVGESAVEPVVSKAVVEQRVTTEDTNRVAREVVADEKPAEPTPETPAGNSPSPSPHGRSRSKRRRKKRRR